MDLPNGVKVEQLSIRFYQAKDDMDTSLNDVQTISINTEDGGAGVYYVINTERWAVSDIEELIQLLEAFKQIIK